MTNTSKDLPLRLSEFAPYQLAVVGNRLSHAIAALYEQKYNIQIPEWRILMTLAEWGQLSAHEVADRTSMDRARVSRAQRRMADLGLISVTIDELDRRKTLLDLTQKGWELVESIVPDAERTGDWLLGVLEQEEREYLNVIMKKLMERAEELRKRGGILE